LQKPTKEHRLFEVLFVILREGRHFRLKLFRALVRTLFEALQPLAHIREKPRFGLFAVGKNVDARVGLSANTIDYRGPHLRFILIAIERSAFKLCLHQVEQSLRARKAAHMGRQDSIRVLLN
jgi:hypothetical protein